MTTLRIALAQVPVTEEVASNVEAIGRGIAFAAEEKADILVTPEGSLSGYTHAFDRGEVERALATVTSQARAAKVGLALGTCFIEEDGKCYNEARLYERDGTFLGFHSKTLVCGTVDEETSRGEIEHFAVAPLRTFTFKGIVVGALVCNDLWANPRCTPMDDPHLLQELSRRGARVVFHPLNGGRGANEWRDVHWNFHESNLRLRAEAAKLWVATVDSCYPLDLRCSAPGGIVDPKGAFAVRTRPQGECLIAHTIEVR